MASFAFMLVGFLGLVRSHSCYATTTATLELGTSNLSTTVTQGDVAYLSSTISATTTDTESYTLTITGPTNLNGASTIAGANGNTPANMANNTWGYAYNQTGDNSTKTYSSFTGSAQELESGTIANGTAKDITFAAKFGSDAVSGHYSAEVTINLTATPKVVTNVFGVETMQEMTQQICSNAKENDTAQLKDSRDGKYYWITKLKDGNCWMTQNADYDISTSEVSDVQKYSGTSCSGWQQKLIKQYCDPGEIGSGTAARGNYYSTYVAQYVCPSNGYLPSLKDYENLISLYGNATSINNAPASFMLGGYVGSSGLSDYGAKGYYLSSKTNSMGDGVYVLTIDGTSNALTTSIQTGWYGSMVRCFFGTTKKDSSGGIS